MAIGVEFWRATLAMNGASVNDCISPRATHAARARESWVDWTRVIACFAVVVLHVTVPTVFASPQGAFSPSWYYGLFYCAAFRWCVPVFVMVSGALVLRPQKVTDARTFYGKRLKTILPACLFWSVFFLGFQHVFVSARLPAYQDSLTGIIQNLWWGMPYYHLWYLYMIVGLYLLAPFLVHMLNQLSRPLTRLFLLVTFSVSIVYAFGIHFFGGQTFYWALFPLYIPYFVLGRYITQHQLARSFSVRGLTACAILLVAATVILSAFLGFVFRNISYGLYLYDYLSVTMVPLSIVVFLLFSKMDTSPRTPPPALALVSDCTLGIFVVHPILIFALKRTGVSVTDFFPLLSIPSIALLAFVFSGLLTLFLKRLPLLKHVV